VATKKQVVTSILSHAWFLHRYKLVFIVENSVTVVGNQFVHYSEIRNSV